MVPTVGLVNYPQYFRETLIINITLRLKMKNHIETTFVDADGDSQTLQQILNIMQELKCNNEQIKKQAEIVIYKMWLKDVLLK